MKNLIDGYCKAKQAIFDRFSGHEWLYVDIGFYTGLQWSRSRAEIIYSRALTDPGHYDRFSCEPRSGLLISDCGGFIGVLTGDHVLCEEFSIFERSLECVCVQDNSPPYNHRYKLKSEVK